MNLKIFIILFSAVLFNAVLCASVVHYGDACRSVSSKELCLVATGCGALADGCSGTQHSHGCTFSSLSIKCLHKFFHFPPVVDMVETSGFHSYIALKESVLPGSGTPVSLRRLNL